MKSKPAGWLRMLQRSNLGVPVVTSYLSSTLRTRVVPGGPSAGSGGLLPGHALAVCLWHCWHLPHGPLQPSALLAFFQGPRSYLPSSSD